jgi:tetratricopeptide (TPR) repeat protein
MASDYLIVLVGKSIGEATAEELLSARSSQVNKGTPRVLVFVEDWRKTDACTSAREAFKNLVTELVADSSIDAKGAGAIASCVNDKDIYWFSNASYVNNALLKALNEDGLIKMPYYMDSPSGRWLAYNGISLVPVFEVGGEAHWPELITGAGLDSDKGGAVPETGAIRMFVATSPDGRSDGTELLNFARVLNDIYHDQGIDFEAFVFNSMRIDPNATDEVAEQSQYFFIIARMETDESQHAKLEAAIEAYRASLDADGDGYPRILTFFEDADDASKDVVELRKELADRGHYYSVFSDMEAIKYMVAIEIARDMNKPSLRFANGLLQMNGLPLHIDVTDIPIFKNHEKLSAILKELDSYDDAQSDDRGRKKLLDIASELENCILDLSEQVSALCATAGFEHLSKAQRDRIKMVRTAYDAGNYDEVVNLLSRVEILDEMSAIRARGRRAHEDARITQELGRLCIRQECLLIAAIIARGVTENDDGIICGAYEQCIAIARDCNVEYDFLEQYIQYLWHGEQHAKAEDVCIRVLNRFEELEDSGESLTNEQNAYYARTLRQLADTVDNDTTRRNEAIDYASQALDLQEGLGHVYRKKAHGRRMRQRDTHAESELQLERDIADTKNSLGVYHIHLRQFELARDFLWSALCAREELRARGAQISDELLGKSYNNYAAVLDSLGQYDEAVEYHEKSLSIRRGDDSVGVVERDHYVAMSLNSYASHYFFMAKSLLKEGDVANAVSALSQAEELHRQALAMRKQLIIDNPRKFAPRLAASQKNLAGCILLRNDLVLGIDVESYAEVPDEYKQRYEEAETFARDSWLTRKECEKEFPGMYVKVVKESRELLDKCLARQGKL